MSDLDVRARRNRRPGLRGGRDIPGVSRGVPHAGVCSSVSRISAMAHGHGAFISPAGWVVDPARSRPWRELSGGRFGPRCQGLPAVRMQPLMRRTAGGPTAGDLCLFGARRGP